MEFDRRDLFRCLSIPNRECRREEPSEPREEKEEGSNDEMGRFDVDDEDEVVGVRRSC